MSLLGLALVLAAACCHATWNLLVKRVRGGPELVWLFSAVTVVLYLPIAVLVVAVEQLRLGVVELGFIAGSTLFHLAYFLLLQRGYRHGALSVIYPTARATGPLLATVFAVLVLGEALSLQVALGGLAIIVGVLCLTGGLRRGGDGMRAAVLFGLATGVLIASYTVWDAHAVSALMIPPILLDYVSSVGRAVVLAPLAARRRDSIRALWRDHRVAVVAIAVFNPLAYILVLYALTFTPVVYVAPTREISVLITVVLGSVLLGEGDLPRRLAWSALILVGVALLATG